MINLTTNENKRLTTLISGTYLLLVSVLAVVFLNGAPATTVQADSHCGEDVCQNESAAFTVNMQVEEGSIDFFERVGSDDVYLNDEITLDWDTTDAQDVAACGDNIPSGWGGTKSESGPETLNAPSSSGDYDYELCTYDINGDETDRATTTVNVAVRDATINEFYSNPTEVEENESFSLHWGTSHAGLVEARDSWTGSLSATGTRSGLSQGTADTYDYTLYVENEEGTQSEERTVTVTVVEPPRYNVSISPDPVDLDGEPGSTASTTLELTAENGYDGEIDLSIVDVEPPINTSSGDRILFTFSDDSPTVTAPGSETVTINMQTLQSIRSDTKYTVTVGSEDTTGTADDEYQETEFEINAEGFSPRTIEEF